MFPSKDREPRPRLSLTERGVCLPPVLCQHLTIEAQIREFLAANFFLGEDPSALAGDASLIEAGVIDSTGVLELVGFLEDAFDVRILDDELVPENLDTIDNIVRFVNGKRAAESAA